MRIFGLFGLIPLVAACHSTEEVCAEAALVEPTLVLGTWDDDFQIWDDGAVLDLVFGMQGGYHIWGAVKVAGMNPGDGEMVSPSNGLFGGQTDGGTLALEPDGHDVVSLDFQIAFQDDVVPPMGASFDTFLDGTVEEALSPAQTVFVSLWELVDGYGDGETIAAEMSVTATDACGTALTESRGFTILVEDAYY
jgi:hypothetical protein